MAKKPVALDGLLNIENRPTDTGIPQRGAGQPPQEKKPKREGEKRLTLALLYLRPAKMCSPSTLAKADGEAVFGV